MKRFKMVFTIALLIVSLTASYSIADAAKDSNIGIEPQKQILSSLETQLKDFVYDDTERRNWQLHDLKVTLIESNTNDNEAEAIYDVERMHTLNYETSEDVPIIKGKQSYLNENRNNMSEAQIEAVNNDIKMWEHELDGYIKNPQYCFDRIKVSGNLNNGVLEENSVKFYGEGPTGEYILLNIEDIPNPDEVESLGYKSANEVQTTTEEMSGHSITASYDRLAARDYANT